MSSKAGTRYSAARSPIFTAGFPKASCTSEKLALILEYGSQRFRDICADDWAKHNLDSRSAAVASALVTLAYKHNHDAEAMGAEFEDTPLCTAWEAKGKWTRLGEREIARAIEFAKTHATKADDALTTDEIASFLIGEPRVFDPREYAVRPLSAPGQKFSGWFPRGRFALVSGASGAMKTTFVAQALVSGRDGKPFLGHDPGRMSFCFIFADRGEFDAEETFERMGMTGQVPFKCINELDRAGSLRVIAKAAQEYDVLFIDGGDLLVEDNNDGTHVKVFTSSVQRIARHYGVAMIVSTGANKQSDKAIKEGAQRRSITKGSEVWGRTGGTVFSLNSENHDGTDVTRRLVVQHRNAAAEKFLLKMDIDGRLCPVAEPTDVVKADEMEWLERQGASWFRPSDVQKGCEVGRTKAFELCAEWRKRQLVVREIDGNGWKYRWNGISGSPPAAEVVEAAEVFAGMDGDQEAA